MEDGKGSAIICIYLTAPFAEETRLMTKCERVTLMGETHGLYLMCKFMSSAVDAGTGPGKRHGQRGSGMKTVDTGTGRGGGREAREPNEDRRLDKG